MVFSINRHMRKIILPAAFFICIAAAHAQQAPCSTNPVYRQFDFWLGEWEAFAQNGNKAGDSKISKMLDDYRHNWKRNRQAQPSHAKDNEWDGEIKVGDAG